MAHIIYSPISGCAETVPNIKPSNDHESNITKNNLSEELIDNENIEITLYPNPINQTFYIKTNKDADLKIVVVDGTGRALDTEITKFDAFNHTRQIHFKKEISAGSYFVRIYHENILISTHKITKL